MKQLFFFALWIPLALFATEYYNLPIQKGWQLVGFPYAISDMKQFDSQDVSLIWKYDNQAKQWEGYSDDFETHTKLKEQNITQISSIEEYSGVWIYSKRDWILSFQKQAIEHPEGGEKHGVLPLYQGWNLVSIPSNIAYSPTLFEGFKVWKYSDQAWQFNQDSTLYPTIKDLGATNAVWVYSPTQQTIDLSQAASKLSNFSSLESLEAYIREMARFNVRPFYGCYTVSDVNFPNTMVDGGFPTPVANPEPSVDSTNDAQNEDAQNTSTTNVQEEGVDEADILKHNGEVIVYLDRENASIKVTRFSKLLTGESQFSTMIPLEEGLYPQESYLIGDRLVVISSRYTYYTYLEEPAIGAPGITKPSYEVNTPQFQVDFYALQSDTEVKHLQSYRMDGNYKTSRVTGGQLYLVSDFFAQLELEYEKVYFDDHGECSAINYWEEWRECYGVYHDAQGTYRYDYDHYTITSESLLPRYSVGDDSMELIRPEKFYSSKRLNQSPQITSVTKFDMNSSQLSDNVSVLGYINTVYASTGALYLTSNQYPYYYNYDAYKEQLTIYKITLDTRFDYQGMGLVEGRVLNQFSLGEYHNTLRVATTEGFSWSWENQGTNNRLFNLQEHNGTLETVGKLENLGEENEEIFAVRFMGEKGFVVTARQTDPFYTLDLSDPLVPKKVGELKIDGFSTYLHPMGEDIILSIGRINGSDFKLELYDIENFASPQVADTITLRDTGYNSNHKSYTFRDDLFSLPLYSWGYNPQTHQGYLFGIDMIQKSLQIRQNDVIGRSDESTRSLIFDRNGTSFISYFNTNSEIQTFPIIP